MPMPFAHDGRSRADAAVNRSARNRSSADPARLARQEGARRASVGPAALEREPGLGRAEARRAQGHVMAHLVERAAAPSRAGLSTFA